MKLPWKLQQRLRYKLTHISRFPKAKLSATFINLAARGFIPRHIIDVGANRGKWSRDAAEVFPDAVFTLIEPQIEMASHFRRFCQRHPHSRWIQAGAGATQGKLALTVVPDTVSSSFVIRRSPRVHRARNDAKFNSYHWIRWLTSWVASRRKMSNAA